MGSAELISMGPPLQFPLTIKWVLKLVAVRKDQLRTINGGSEVLFGVTAIKLPPTIKWSFTSYYKSPSQESLNIDFSERAVKVPTTDTLVDKRSKVATGIVKNGG